jgi:hypothetical protein
LSATPARTASQSDAFAQLLRGSVPPTALAGLVCAGVGLFSSPKAAWSAALGALLVIFFFSLTLLVMKRTADMEPTAVMIAALVTYTFKVVVVGVAVFLLRDVSWLSAYAAGLSIIACAVVWLFFEMRSYKRLRIFAYDPDGAASLDRDREAPGAPAAGSSDPEQTGEPRDES